MEGMVPIISYVASTFGGGFFGYFFGWLFTRRKYNAEVESTKVQNFDQALDAYKKMYEDMIEDLKHQVEDLKNENDSLKSELAENRKQILALTNFVLANALNSVNDSEGLEAIKNIIK